MNFAICVCVCVCAFADENEMKLNNEITLSCDYTALLLPEFNVKSSDANEYSM